MRIILADSLQDSLMKLEPEEQRLVKQKIVDFQFQPATKGKRYHKLKGTPQGRFWSFSIDMDLRLIVFQEGDVRVLCHVDHHKPAYEWAERHVIEEHPETAEIQMVEIRHEVREQLVHTTKEIETLPPIFERYDPDYLLALGVPPAWLDAIRLVTEDTLLEALVQLPDAVSERLLKLAEGKPVPRPVVSPGARGWDHPDTSRHFRLMSGETELRQALDFPWEKWVVFLHPEQRSAAASPRSGPTLVTGGAGTGKTVVALHRARHLAESDPRSRVLLTTYSRTLARSLTRSAGILMGSDSPLLERIDVLNLHRLAAERWAARHGHEPAVIDGSELRKRLLRARAAAGLEDISPSFLEAEWSRVIDAWAIHDWPGYRSHARVGRGHRLGARQRQRLWRAFEPVLSGLRQDDLYTWSSLCEAVREDLRAAGTPPYDHVIADEAQDFGPAELRLLRALTAEGPDDLFLCGDAGQRIYQARFPWLAAGIDVRGRSKPLHVNYRTTEQIRRFADDLRHVTQDEADPLSVDAAAISRLGGPEPRVVAADRREEAIAALALWLRDLLNDGYAPEDIAIFGRLKRILAERALPAVEQAGLEAHDLGQDDEPMEGCVSLATMHRAKGLEFRAVAAIGCEDRLLPLSWALRNHDDGPERDAFIERERHLLYVACTRARERLLVSHVGAPSPFLGVD